MKNSYIRERLIYTSDDKPTHYTKLEIIDTRDESVIQSFFFDEYYVFYDRFIFIKIKHLQAFVYDIKTNSTLFLNDYSATNNPSDYHIVKTIKGLIIIKNKNDVFLFSHCLKKEVLNDGLITQIDNTILKQISFDLNNTPYLINVICSESLRDEDKEQFNITSKYDIPVITRKVDASEKICVAFTKDNIITISSSSNYLEFKEISFSNFNKLNIIQELNPINEVTRIYLNSLFFDLKELNNQEKFKYKLINFEFIPIYSASTNEIFIAVKDTKKKIKFLYSITNDEEYYLHWPTLNHFEISEEYGDIWIKEVNEYKKIEKLENFSKEIAFDSFICTNYFEINSYHNNVYIKELNKDGKVEWLYLLTNCLNENNIEPLDYSLYNERNIEIRIIDSKFILFDRNSKESFIFDEENTFVCVNKQD